MQDYWEDTLRSLSLPRETLLTEVVYYKSTRFACF